MYFASSISCAFEEGTYYPRYPDPRNFINILWSEAETRYFTDEMDVTQGKLAIGWRLGECMEDPDVPAIRVFNALYPRRPAAARLRGQRAGEAAGDDPRPRQR